MTHWKSGMRLTPARLGASESGTVNVSISASTFGTATITFAEAFPAAPSFVAQVVTGAGTAIKSTVLVTALSTTQATIRVDITASNTVTVPVHWQAEQI